MARENIFISTVNTKEGELVLLVTGEDRATTENVLLTTWCGPRRDLYMSRMRYKLGYVPLVGLPPPSDGWRGSRKPRGKLARGSKSPWHPDGVYVKLTPATYGPHRAYNANIAPCIISNIHEYSTDPTCAPQQARESHICLQRSPTAAHMPRYISATPRDLNGGS